MGLPAPHLKFLIKKNKKYNFSGPLLTLGNQDVYATEGNVERWLAKEGVEFNRPAEIIYSSSGDVPEINKEALNYIHAKTFFEFLGIKESDYYDIDKFDFDKPRIIHDLQHPVDSRYHNFFNFILDSGTLEHIFDVKAVMENIIKMTKVGGYVLQIIPAQNFLNHGFYQFSPTFFYDFYSDNGFEIVEAYLVEIRGNVHRFHKYNQERDYVGLSFKPGNRLLNCFLVRKVFQADKIISPDQYFYKKLSKDRTEVAEDFQKASLDKIVSKLRRLVPIKFHGLFFRAWVFLKRITRKKEYSDFNHKW